MLYNSSTLQQWSQAKCTEFVQNEWSISVTFDVVIHHFNVNGNLSNCEWFCLEASSAYFIYGCCKNYIKWWVTVADEHWNIKRPQTCFNESPVPKALCTAASQLNLGFSNFSSSFQSNPIWTVRNIRNWKKGEKKWMQIDLSTWIFCCVRGLS